MQTIVASAFLMVSTVLIGSAQAQQQQISGTAQYCLNNGNGPVKCEFHTMAHCEKAKTATSDQCVPHSQVQGTNQGTVGGPSTSSREQPSAPGQQKD